MNSYQKLKAKNEELLAENAKLRRELIAKGNVFFMRRRWLGPSSSYYLGVVIDGVEHNTLEIDTHAR